MPETTITNLLSLFFICNKNIAIIQEKTAIKKIIVPTSHSKTILLERFFPTTNKKAITIAESTTPSTIQSIYFFILEQFIVKLTYQYLYLTLLSSFLKMDIFLQKVESKHQNYYRAFWEKVLLYLLLNPLSLPNMYLKNFFRHHCQ